MIALAAYRIDPHGGGEAVYDHVDLPKIAADQVYRLRLDLVGKRVAIDAFCIAPVCMRELLKRGGVIPPGGRRACADRGLIVSNADRVGVCAVGKRDPACKTVAG